jgi:16S rRNA pseudouridine516 synthase
MAVGGFMAEYKRLDKLLGELGIGTRSQIKEAAKKGRITVNGTPVKDTSLKVNPEQDDICMDGVRLSYVEYEYLMLNKPAGVISATEDGAHTTVLNLITDSVRNDLFPVGRLDIDTEGLLLLTNDGALAHRLLSPKKHVDKTYYLKTDTPIPETAVALMGAGFVVDEELTALPAKLEILGAQEAYLTIHEGKFHQVKRMMHAVGCEVTYLKRISMGPLVLDEALEPGAYRRLTEEELAALRRQE